MTAGGEPAGDTFDDLRDAAAVDSQLLGDLPVVEAVEFDAFVDIQVAAGGRTARFRIAPARRDGLRSKGRRVGS